MATAVIIAIILLTAGLVTGLIKMTRSGNKTGTASAGTVSGNIVGGNPGRIAPSPSQQIGRAGSGEQQQYSSAQAIQLQLSGPTPAPLIELPSQQPVLQYPSGSPSMPTGMGEGPGTEQQVHQVEIPSQQPGYTYTPGQTPAPSENMQPVPSENMQPVLGESSSGQNTYLSSPSRPDTETMPITGALPGLSPYELGWLLVISRLQEVLSQLLSGPAPWLKWFASSAGCALSDAWAISR